LIASFRRRLFLRKKGRAASTPDGGLWPGKISRFGVAQKARLSSTRAPSITRNTIFSRFHFECTLAYISQLRYIVSVNPTQTVSHSYGSVRTRDARKALRVNVRGAPGIPSCTDRRTQDRSNDCARLSCRNSGQMRADAPQKSSARTRYRYHDG